MGALLNPCAAEEALLESPRLGTSEAGIPPAPIETGSPAAPTAPANHSPPTESGSGSAPAPIAGSTSATTCSTEAIVVYQPEQPSAIESPCANHPKTSTETAETAKARAYLIETAMPGGTMTRQGPELAIGRLHPEFVNRLARALREARQAGLSAGIFSAYRPPIFGVGGFMDKFNSLHTYGLAVDMYGIGGPGTPEALLWHDIAARHGVVCPYGPHNPVEWNHCQPTRVKIILAENPLRETVTEEGPINLEAMFGVGNSLIAAGSVGAPTGNPPAYFFTGRPRKTAAHFKSGIKATHNPRAIQTGRFPFKGVAFKGPPLSGENVGASLTGGVSRAVDTDYRTEMLKSRSRSRTSRGPKPIVMSRILAARSATRR